MSRRQPLGAAIFIASAERSRASIRVRACNDIGCLMPAFRDFEIEAIKLMAEGVMTERLLAEVLSAETADSYDYTGSGYFITVRNPAFPEERHLLSDPLVVGQSGDIQAGFAAYFGNREFTLECHTWGAVDVPAGFRDMQVQITTPPNNYVDVRGAT
jgi:hypothetical protein